MPISSFEKNVILRISLTVFSRMLGLFSLIPIVSVLVISLPNYTPLKAGLAIGLYGLTQAVLQIPFGIASDYFGRKKIALFGISLFFLGSLVGVFSETIDHILWARFLQGAGAISSVTSAWMSDLLEPKHHKTGFMILGLLIGMAFILSIFLAPLLSLFFSLNDLFFSMMVLAVVAFFLLYGLEEKVQKPLQVLRNISSSYTQKKTIVIICVCGFVLHFMLPVIFLLVPRILIHYFSIPLHWHGFLYVLCVVLSLPFLVFLNKKFRTHNKMLVSLGFLCLFLSIIILLIAYTSLFFFTMGLLVFFLGLNVIEATLPAWIISSASESQRGRVMGYLMSSKFFGVFFGGIFGGILLPFLI